MTNVHLSSSMVYPAQSRGRFDRVIERLVDGTRLGHRTDIAIAISIIAITLGLLWLLVYATNGTTNVFLHAMYVPIIAASLTLGLTGGLFTALTAATLVGPLMPLNVELGTAQPIENTIYRAAFFLLIAATTSAFASVMRRRHHQVLQSRANITELLGRNLRLFARLVAERDEQTGGHCDRVANNAVTLGRALETNSDTERTLYWAGMLHDLGKLAVPEAILRKPGRLTSEEFDVIKMHPARGADLLLQISGDFADIAAGVRSHHERWDGGGYPDRLSGESIPMIARILAVVDVYEAVTSVRPYRGPMSREQARSMLVDGSGRHFDPHVVETFLNLERNGLIKCEVTPEPLFESVGFTGFDTEERERVSLN